MPAADYKVDLEVFEGPLDLLLHLVKKHELDVFDIPVSFVTQKYLEYLDLMRQLNLEVAGEYLLMAATLAHIKSRELLPTPDPSQADGPDGEGDEDDVDPRQQLIARLLEYQKYRDAGVVLGDRPVVGRNVWTRGASQDDVAEGEGAEADAPLAEIPVFQLLEALSDVLAKARVKLTHDVIVERLSITDRINQLVDRLERDGTFTFQSCFDFLSADGELPLEQARHQVVVTFLAVLEMARLRLIRIQQAEAGMDIHLTRAVDDLRERAKTGVAARDEEYR
jgi:segregation and condensation protein A